MDRIYKYYTGCGRTLVFKDIDSAFAYVLDDPCPTFYQADLGDDGQFHDHYGITVNGEGKIINKWEDDDFSIAQRIYAGGDDDD